MSGKTRVKKLSRILSMMMIAVMLFAAVPVFAGTWGKTTHVGKYYLKFNESNGHVYYSTKKNSGFKKTPVEDRCFVSNGKQIIYVMLSGSYDDIYNIASYDIASKKVKKLKKLKENLSWTISGVKGKYLWIESDDWAYAGGQGRTDLYRYDISANKLKRFKKCAYLFHLKGAYYMYSYGKPKYYKFKDKSGTWKYEAVKSVICTPTAGGKLKTVKKLGYVCDVEDSYLYDGSNWGSINTLYFTKDSSHDLYKVKYNGNGMKKIKSFKGAVEKIGKKSCKVVTKKGSTTYKY